MFFEQFGWCVFFPLHELNLNKYGHSNRNIQPFIECFGMGFMSISMVCVCDFSIFDSIKYLPIRIASDYDHYYQHATDQTTWIATAVVAIAPAAAAGFWVKLHNNNVLEIFR